MLLAYSQDVIGRYYSHVIQHMVSFGRTWERHPSQFGMVPQMVVANS
jgi:hypothetical protein